MSIKARFRSGNIEYFDSITQQVCEATAPVFFHHQFHGHLLDVTNTWTALDVSIVGNTTPAVVDGVGGGVCRLLMTSTSEAQDSGIYMNNIRVFDLNADLVCEFRVDAAVVMGTGVRCVFGLAGDHNLDKDTITEAAWFSMSGDAVLEVETDDTTNNTGPIETGTTMVAGTVYICKIDFRDLSDVKFYIDGARVASSTTFDMSNLSTAEAMMQPYATIDKASGGALGTLDISDVKIWSDATA